MKTPSVRYQFGSSKQQRRGGKKWQFSKRQLHCKFPQQEKMCMGDYISTLSQNSPTWRFPASDLKLMRKTFRQKKNVTTGKNLKERLLPLPSATGCG